MLQLQLQLSLHSDETEGQTGTTATEQNSPHDTDSVFRKKRQVHFLSLVI